MPSSAGKKKDGFGFVPTREGHRKFPQVGRVVIEDNVEIGANCCIDRASIDSTVIHSGSKLDNLVQIAHGVQIGSNTVIAAQTGIIFFMMIRNPPISTLFPYTTLFR